MSIVEKTLTADVDNGDTVVVDYLNSMVLPQAGGNYVEINDNQYGQEDGKIDLVRGATSATITNNTGITWLNGDTLTVQFIELEGIVIKPVTQEMYDALTVKDENTLYSIVEV